ncbi:MAG: DNA primase [Alphaproteobacteria bacterium]|nr:DNA primase [Alphaproteobacteria bacterium]
MYNIRVKYPTNILEQIKQRASLIEEVRRIAPDLKRKGKFWWACCPFHKEKSPSFHVREDEGHYHCFGCGAHGDIFTFMTETRGGTFIETVEHLAAQTGVDLPKIVHDPAAEKVKNDGFKALARVQTFYQRHGQEIAAYIQRRGLTQETVKTFGLGYAPDNWETTRIALVEEGFSTEILRETGLSIQSDKKKSDYDRFRGRLMFPIQDLKDRVIAFGGRIIGEGEPKYLNSPDTPFFNKSYILYNLNRARNYIRQQNQALLVEGYMDVIALWQAGVKTAVAPMGTAVTPEQIQLLWQYHTAPVVCLDGDAAGRGAAARLAKRILPSLTPGKTLRFMYLPEGEDPDSYVQTNGKEAFEKLVVQAIRLEDVLWQDLTDGVDVKSGEGRAQVDAAMQECMKTIKNETVRRHYAAALKDRLWRARGNKQKQSNQVQGRTNWVPQTGNGQGGRQLLALACYAPQLVATYEEDFLELSFENHEDKSIYQVLVQAFLEKRLAKEAFVSYLEECGRQEDVQRLYKQTLLDQWVKEKQPHEIEILFSERLQGIRAEQQVALKRQNMLANLEDGITPETWQQLKALGNRRVLKSS